ncbi:MAG TPA: choice-of-anchor Q domain-containing protein [Lacipirellulaceae bacterium]|nr:choice-of-anchor Q domain-containing protein [Lacipirellulaceae bacterium]
MQRKVFYSRHVRNRLFDCGSSRRRYSFRRGRSTTFRQLAFEPLEDRRVLATFTVTSLGDAAVTASGSAPGTLRQAVYDANHSPGADVIQFASGLNGDVNLSVADDSAVGPSALLIDSPITVQGNANGITIRRDSAAPQMRLFRVTPDADLTLDSVMVAGGVAPSANGGAIYNQGTLTVIASTIYNNTAVETSPASDGSAGRGGAIYNDAGSVSIRNTTLSGNMASRATGSGAAGGYGGAVYDLNGSLNFYNSTISDNAASRSGRDVYILADGSGEVANVQVYSAIVAQADVQPLVPDFVATHGTDGVLNVTGADNLIRSQVGAQSIVVSSGDPMLDMLANNGGPTLTHALLANSPAIDHGSNPLNVTTDQRGGAYSRVDGVAADIGAFELQTVVVPALPGDYNANDFVDAADYVVWRKTIGDDVPQYSGADGNGTSMVDAGDYAVWRASFGAPPSAGASAFALSANAATIDHAAQQDAKSITNLFSAPTSQSTALATGSPLDVRVFAVHSDAKQTSSPRIDPTAPSASPHNGDLKARDEALLAILGERFPKSLSYKTAAAARGDFESGTGHRTTDRPCSNDDALNLSLLQILSLGAASSGIA